MQFTELIGQTILMTIPQVHATQWQKVKLRGVDIGGLWIESQSLTNGLLQLAGAATALRTVVIFLPYHAISQAVHFLDEPSLSERAFGV